MAQTELTPRRLIPEDQVYRQVFDAEVSFDSFVAAQTSRLTVWELTAEILMYGVDRNGGL